MSKKKFTDGLESIFGHSEGGTLKERSPLLVKTKKKERKAKNKEGKKRSSKDFTSDLDSLFEDALKDTLEEKAEKLVKNKTKVSPARKPRPKAVFGLDALIRRTSDQPLIQEEQSKKKRVTFIFDKEKLVKLKKIAKSEKAYLKDIIGDVMAEYIDEYEKAHGDVE